MVQSSPCSGLLLMFVCYGKLKKDSGRFDFLAYYVHRYIRWDADNALASLFGRCSVFTTPGIDRNDELYVLALLCLHVWDSHSVVEVAICYSCLDYILADFCHPVANTSMCFYQKNCFADVINHT